MAKKNQQTSGARAPVMPLKIFFLAAPFAAGLFYEPLSVLASLFLLGYLLYCARGTGALRLAKSPVLLASGVLTLCYALAVLWAVDHGMAILGFVKFLPLPLFAAACGLLTAEQRGELLDTLPLGGAAMTALSLLGALIPGLSAYLLVNGRLAGFFLYPNTFGLYALLGFAVLALRESWDAKDMVCLPILLAGVVLSGSRTVAALLIAAVIVFCVVRKDNRRRLVLAGAAAVAVLGAVFAGRLGNVTPAARLVTDAAGGSTFYGRLLYYRDALPVILRHPLGLGYLGYYYLQGSFQTGVYSVMHIHNDVLQFLLDVGWAPTVLLGWVVVRGFLRGDGRRRAVIALMTAHCLFDFDLQFAAMDLVLLLALEPEGRDAVTLKRPGPVVLAGVLAAVSLYFGTASALYYFGGDRAAAAVYPGYTMAWIDRLSQAEDAEAMEEAADHVLALNDSVSLAHSAKARACYARGDFQRVIESKERALATARYDRSTYLDYLDMLLPGVELYRAAGDADSAEYCRQIALSIPGRMAAVEAGTSALGRRITDQPDLSLPAEYRAALAALEN